MLLQRSLFPDAFEVHEQALRALDDLDLEAARRWLLEVKSRDPGLPELASWSACIEWLRRELGGGLVADECLALAFALVPEECRRGTLDKATAERIDQVLAHQGLQRMDRSRVFLDGEERVHRGVLLLVRGSFPPAMALLRETLAQGRDGRADLWWSLAEACLKCDRSDDANAAYVRALLLDPQAVDLHRSQHVRLTSLLDELRASRDEQEARGLLLVHAWLEGILSIPPENSWLERHLSRLHLATALRSGATPAERARRFAWLLYLECSRRPGDFEESARDEMKALAPELFERVMHRLSALLRRSTPRLAW